MIQKTRIHAKAGNWNYIGSEICRNNRYYKFGNEIHKYEIALEKTGLVPLSNSRENLINKFALQFLNSASHKGLFQIKNNDT